MVFFLLLLLLLLTSMPMSPSLAQKIEDVTCLRNFKSSVSDPNGYLSSWNFANISAGSVCSFAGIECWNPNENRVLSIRLSGFSLSGQIPSALRLCSSLTGLDLSVNSLSGNIPSQLCSWLPYLVSLDLSSNNFSGPIPSSLSKCKYLNSLSLSSNAFSGHIPDSLASLNRLKQLNLSSNQLSGHIPSSLATFGSSSFADNPNLCGEPVARSCGEEV